jgi:hypothetical protein
MVRRPPGRSDPAALRVVTEARREGRSAELWDRGLRRPRKKYGISNTQGVTVCPEGVYVGGVLQ